jgi:hypothetical protein
MKKALFPAIVLVLASVALGATVFREQVARAAPGIQDVFVTNSTREPVPVHKQGTADVNVTNAPLAVHESGEQPVQQGLEWAFSGGACIAEDTYTVPEGKYLRIEHVTFFQHVAQDLIGAFSVQTSLPSGAAEHFLEHTENGTSEPVSIYASPGSVVSFRVVFVLISGCAGLRRGSFSGVLIDAP